MRSSSGFTSSSVVKLLGGRGTRVGVVTLVGGTVHVNQIRSSSCLAAELHSVCVVTLVGGTV